MQRLRSLIVAASLVLAACQAAPPPEIQVAPATFAGLDACAIVYDRTAGRTVAVFGEARCRERFTACSTFKLPLAVMAFDAGILRDADSVLAWDGTKYEFDGWNQDQSAASWMKNSVVWYSQRLTPMLGQDRVQAYLDAFDYGNRDLSGGLTMAWLTSGGDARATLKISAFEQMRFLQRLWDGDLPVSRAAVEKAKGLIRLAATPGGYEFFGKTGSGRFGTGSGDFGWFVGRLSGHQRDYLIVVGFSRAERGNDWMYPGALARNRAEEIFRQNGLW